MMPTAMDNRNVNPAIRAFVCESCVLRVGCGENHAASYFIGRLLRSERLQHVHT